MSESTEESTTSCCAARRDIFLKIEGVTAYSPLAPQPCARRWGLDVMYNPGHELGRVQPGEVVATTLDLLVYHEYFDTHYTHPNTAKLVPADSPWQARSTWIRQRLPATARS